MKHFIIPAWLASAAEFPIVNGVLLYEYDNIIWHALECMLFKEIFSSLPSSLGKLYILKIDRLVYQGTLKFSKCLKRRIRNKYFKWTTCRFFDYNLGQNFVEKFTKLSKTGFYMECFVAYLLQFCSITIDIFFLQHWLGIQCQFQAFLAIFLKFFHFLGS